MVSKAGEAPAFMESENIVFNHESEEEARRRWERRLHLIALRPAAKNVNDTADPTHGQV
jgi:hypothetical protein